MFLPNHFCLKHYCIFLHFCPETTHNQLIPTLQDKTTWAWCHFNICFSQSGNCVWHVVSCILSRYIKGEVRGGDFIDKHSECRLQMWQTCMLVVSNIQVVSYLFLVYQSLVRIVTDRCENGCVLINIKKKLKGKFD